jgi:pimeloyl-ACP methyl ester carboxylesterase
MWHGLQSAAGLAAFPFGTRWCRSISYLHTPERLERGLVLLLPGIESASVFEVGIACGLTDAGVEYGIEVHDWTTGSSVGFLRHLCGLQRNRRAAEELARKVEQYQNRFPGRPVHLIGHSGGGGLAVFALEALSPGRSVTSALLLAPALSPRYDLRTALKRTEIGICNFYSALDVFLLAAGTLALGTIDRRHAIAAGARGFTLPPGHSEVDRALYDSKLREERFRLEMVRSGHLGGHFGCASRLFAADWLAPLLKQPAL